MPEVKLPAPVKAVLVPDMDSVKATPGAFEYYSYRGRFPAGMIYNCPCGCGVPGALAFRPIEEEGRASWEWNGNREAPTLSPSINHVGHWHGWLREGYFVDA